MSAKGWSYYRRLANTGLALRVCGGCNRANRELARRCVGCGDLLRKRRRVKKDRSLDARVTHAERLLDKALADAVRAVNRVRYYKNRLRALERERRAKAAGKPRPVRRPQPARGIVLRNHPQE